MLCITPQNTTFGDNTAECPKPITCTPTEKVQGISGSLIMHLKNRVTDTMVTSSGPAYLYFTNYLISIRSLL